MNSANKFLLAWALGLTALLLMGLTIPNTFAPGTTIRSAEMKANFAAVKAAVDVLEAQSTANTIQLSGLSPESGVSPGQIHYARDHGLVASYVEPTTGMRFVLIPPGEFWMGSPTSEVDREDDEIHRHVRLTQAFYLSVHEVTKAQFKLAFPDHERFNAGDARRPVVAVCHDHAVAFAAWLSGATGNRYALPTEAQWEYACRAGTTTAFSFGANINPAQVNYDGTPYRRAPVGLNRGDAMDVGSFPANAWGLYDMHGNVSEWCADWYDEYVGSLRGVMIDPTGGTGSSDFRVCRGGSYADGARNARSARRRCYHYRLENARWRGFRLARPVASWQVGGTK